ncbi:hypothetical protein BCGT_2545 [Mycobacterium tuberculosis variant bovis BCG str. ATCC 35743]|nr:hypothetical protein BCGT_2545 [Mycobacterium tuberculosis variant bovis BCG str. ATCC 35743]ALA79258.1 Uncharacterized protein BCGR_2941 [Mycobacterium tuberculosis variant bovis BCG]KDA14408.1 hypothetical protein CO60_2291 [Mycobacterium tuberculosis]BAW13783.1 hypothetical protein NCGM946K2_3015 [Mycobacterium tuberculosis]
MIEQPTLAAAVLHNAKSAGPRSTPTVRGRRRICWQAYLGAETDSHPLGTLSGGTG